MYSVFLMKKVQFIKESCEELLRKGHLFDEYAREL